MLLQFVLLTSHALDGIAHAAEALSGRAIDARKQAEFYRVCRASTAWALAMALLVTLVFTLGKPWLLPLFTALPSVLAQVNTRVTNKAKSEEHTSELQSRGHLV